MLSDVEIRRSLENGALVVRPIQDLRNQLQPNSLDLHLGTRFRKFREHPKVPYLTRQSNWDLVTQETEGPRYLLQPGEFLLGTTAEWIGLDNTIVGRVEGKSSWGRVGLLIHATAGFIDSGFGGEITLELKNINSIPILLTAGESICQLSLDWNGEPCERPYGPERGSHYQGQTGPTPSRM